MVAFAEQARGRGFRVIVAGAGGAAHLPWHGGRSHDSASDWSACAEPCFVGGGFTAFDCADARWYPCGHRWRLEGGLTQVCWRRRFWPAPMTT
jgi:hypothetical protein